MELPNNFSNPSRNIGAILRISHLNIESISQNKAKKVLSFLANSYDIHVLAVQETHTATDAELERRGSIEGFKIAGAVHSPRHGVATYVRSDINDYHQCG